MASDYTTGLVARDDLLEWTTLQGGKDGLAVVATHRTEWKKPSGGEAAPRSPEPEAVGEDAADTQGETTEAAIPQGPAESAGDGAEVRGPTPEEFQKALSGVRGDTVVGLVSHDLLIRVIDLPAVDPAELASMVELQVDKFSPFPVETMVVSYEVIKRTHETCRVLVAAAQQSIVDSMGETLRTAGVEPARVDAVILGWWRLLREARALEDEARQVIVILDGSCRDIAVFQDGLPVVVRSLNMDLDAAEEDIVRDLAEDVSSTFMSLELEHGVASHCSVAVWHRGDVPDEIKTELETACQCPVSTHLLDDLPPVSEGLARRQANNVAGLDLTPRSWRLAGSARLFKKNMVIAAAAVFGVWLLGMGGLFLGLTLQNLRLSNLQTQAEEWRGPATEVRGLRRRVSVIRQYTDRRSSVLECLREICLVLPREPDKVELAQFSYRKTDVLNVGGSAVTVAQIYAFKRKLDKSSLFGDVILEGPRWDPRRKKQVFEMNIELTERPE